MRSLAGPSLFIAFLMACGGGGGGGSENPMAPSGPPTAPSTPPPPQAPQLLSVGGLYQITSTRSGNCAGGTLQVQVYQSPIVVTHTPGHDRAIIKNEEIDSIVIVNRDGSFADLVLFSPPWMQFATGKSLIGQFTASGFQARFTASGWVPSVEDSCSILITMNAVRVSGTNTFP